MRQEPCNRPAHLHQRRLYARRLAARARGRRRLPRQGRRCAQARASPAWRLARARRRAAVVGPRMLARRLPSCGSTPPWLLALLAAGPQSGETACLVLTASVRCPCARD